MKLLTSKTALAFCWLSADIFCHQAFAHGFSGALTSGATATDYWAVDCDQTQTFDSPGWSALPAKGLFVSIRDTTTGASATGVSVINPNAPADQQAKTTIDLVGGIVNFDFSPTIEIDGGEGTYTLVVFHTGSSNDSYRVELICRDANGDISGTGQPIRISNQ